MSSIRQIIFVSISLRGAEKIGGKEKRLSAPPAQLGGPIHEKKFLGVPDPEHYAWTKSRPAGPPGTRAMRRTKSTRFAYRNGIFTETPYQLSTLATNAEILDDSGVWWTLLHTWRDRSRGCGVQRVVPEARLNLVAKELGFVQIRHQMTEL